MHIYVNAVDHLYEKVCYLNNKVYRQYSVNIFMEIDFSKYTMFSFVPLKNKNSIIRGRDV